MGWYGSRVSELNDLMSRAAEGADDKVRRALSDGITKVGSAGDTALSAMLDDSERASAGNLGTQRRWGDRCTAAKAEISRCFGDAAKDNLLTPGLQLFWYQALEHEMAFFESLSKVATPQLHDDLLVHQDLLNKMLGELWDKWTYLLSKDVVFENDQRRVVQQLVEMAQKIADDLAPGLHKRIAEGLARATARALDKARSIDDRYLAGKGMDVVKFIAGLLGADIPDQIDRDFAETVQAGAQIYEVQKGYYRNLVATYQSLIQAEKGSVLMMFNATRGEVNTYLDKNNLGKAQVMFDQAKGTLSDWASARATSAQRSEAGNFKDKVCSAVETDWKLTQELDGKFRSKFAGIFIQPLGSETIEQLAEAYLFRKHLDEVAGKGAAGKLNELMGKALSEADAALDQGLRPIDDIIGRAPEEIRELARLENQKFKDHVHAKLRERIQVMLPVIRELAQLFEQGNLAKDFSREELENALR